MLVAAAVTVVVVPVFSIIDGGTRFKAGVRMLVTASRARRALLCFTLYVLYYGASCTLSTRSSRRLATQWVGHGD